MCRWWCGEDDRQVKTFQSDNFCMVTWNKNKKQSNFILILCYGVSLNWFLTLFNDCRLQRTSLGAALLQLKHLVLLKGTQSRRILQSYYKYSIIFVWKQPFCSKQWFIFFAPSSCAPCCCKHPLFIAYHLFQNHFLCA